MDTRVVELAEKIYVQRINFSIRQANPLEDDDGKCITEEDGIHLVEESLDYLINESLSIQAEESILAAEVFYQVKKEVSK